MKKVTALVGSARKKDTYEAVREFLDRLEKLGDVESEIVMLCDYDVGTCRGCKLCFDKGEEFCPHKDDRDVLIEKMMAADGVVFASPNYSFQVSGIMKVFLDRLGFVFHRPRFHGRTSTSIVMQGIYGGKKIVKYLDFVGFGLGFKKVKGSCHTAFEPMTAKERRKRDKSLARHSRRFHKQLMKPAVAPSLVELLIFSMARSSMSVTLDDSSRDYRYYSERGWFKSDYYTAVRLGFLKKILLRLFDAVWKMVYRGKAR